MKKLFFLFTLLFIFSSCKNYNESELLGLWQNENMSLFLEKDKSMYLRMGAYTITGRYRLFSNMMEIIDDQDKVVGRLSIVRLRKDSLDIDLQIGRAKNMTLLRAK